MYLGAFVVMYAMWAGESISPEGDFRITDNDDIRITDSGDERIID